MALSALIYTYCPRVIATAATPLETVVPEDWRTLAAVTERSAIMGGVLAIYTNAPMMSIQNVPGIG
jgi:antitoxin component of RelBE/YafQ-DinJ toxin-antitoxin module